MSAKELSSDHHNRPHEEMIEIKELLKVLIQSQAQQTKSQEYIQNQMLEQKNQMLEQAKSQENIQNQMLEVLRSNNAGKKQQVNDDEEGNNEKEVHDEEKNPGAIASSSGVHEEEIAQGPDDDAKYPELEGGYEANYVPGKHDLLYGALRGNDFETATEYLKNNPDVIKESIAYDASTALHMALYWNRMSMVEEIVKFASSRPIYFEYKRSTTGDTALHIAAFRGNVEAAVMVVGKNSKVTQIRNDSRKTPLEDALQYVSAGQKDVVEYLYSVTRDEEPSPFSGHDGARLLCNAIDAEFYDLALCLVKRFPKLVMLKSLEHGACGLELLARKPYAFGIGTKLAWWQNRVYSLIQVDINSRYAQPVEPNNCHSSEITENDEENPLERSEDTKKEASSKKSHKSIFMSYFGRVSCITKLYTLKLMHKQVDALLRQMIVELKDANRNDEITKFFEKNADIMKMAIKHGIIVFVTECLQHFKYLIWQTMSGQRMLDMAIIERNATIVSFICDCGDDFDDKAGLVSVTVNDEKNTILHLASKLASPSQLNLIPGVALQIQRELQWLKGVESIMSENDRFKKNKEGDTAQILFTKEHKELLKEGQDWMKDTSGSSMIVAALIATVAFAAAFTVPGGNISDSNSSNNGTPVYLGKASFTVFAVADAFALFSSITSVLMFLAIYTSRYSEMDFLRSLPQKLIIGLTTLFISMAAILVAFCAALFIVVGNQFPHGLIPIALFGCVPVVLFAWLQLPLFYGMVRSTYWGSLFQKHKYIHPRDEKNNNSSSRSKKNGSMVSRAKS